MTVKITYSGGVSVLVDGWTHGMIDQMRASWSQITPPSSATIEIVSADDVIHDDEREER